MGFLMQARRASRILKREAISTGGRAENKAQLGGKKVPQKNHWINPRVQAMQRSSTHTYQQQVSIQQQGWKLDITSLTAFFAAWKCQSLWRSPPQPQPRSPAPDTAGTQHSPHCYRQTHGCSHRSTFFGAPEPSHDKHHKKPIY